MPTIRKKSYKGNGPGTGLTDDEREYLLEGYTMLDPDDYSIGHYPNPDYQHGWCPFKDQATMAAAWKKHKKQLMKLEPFQALRCWGWWHYEAPEPRRQISGPKPLEDNSLDQGIPALWEDYEQAKNAVFESEYAYLDRLDLLTPEDKENDKSTD